MFKCIRTLIVAKLQELTTKINSVGKFAQCHCCVKAILFCTIKDVLKVNDRLH